MDCAYCAAMLPRNNVFGIPGVRRTPFGFTVTSSGSAEAADVASLAARRPRPLSGVVGGSSSLSRLHVTSRCFSV